MEQLNVKHLILQIIIQFLKEVENVIECVTYKNKNIYKPKINKNKFCLHNFLKPFHATSYEKV